MAAGGGDDDRSLNTAFIDGVRKFAMNVADLDIDLIDRINPFGEAYAILAKTMNEESLKQVQAIIHAKRVSMTIEEARDLAKRALKFKQERGRRAASAARHGPGPISAAALYRQTRAECVSSARSDLSGGGAG